MRVIGVPFNSAGLPDGVARAPGVLRAAGLVAAVGTDGGDVDTGEPVPVRDPASGLLAVAALTRTTAAVRSAVRTCLDAGEVPLVVGGDCGVLLGALRGAEDAVGAGPGRRLGLVFVDGHEDAWPPSLSTTGEIADSELGIALGLDRDGLPEALARHLPSLDPGASAVLGPRDDAELAEHGVPPLRSTRLRGGAAELHADPAGSARAAGDVARSGGAWWLHVDLDVLATSELPAVDYPQSGGLTWEELDEVVAAALAVPGCVGASVVIYNPDLDEERVHARRIVRFAAALSQPFARRTTDPRMA